MADGPEPFLVEPGEGDARWVTGSLDIVKVTSARSGGGFGLIGSRERRGDATPVHVHENEDEVYIVVEGALSFFIGERKMFAPEGSVVFAPRGIPHAYRVDSARSVIVALNLPGGWEGFFSEVGDPAADGFDPPTEVPDYEQIGRVAARYGVTIVGDPPGPDA